MEREVERVWEEWLVSFFCSSSSRGLKALLVGSTGSAKFLKIEFLIPV
jgi:hypothetical protein